MLMLAEAHFNHVFPDQDCRLHLADIREIDDKFNGSLFDLAISHSNFLNLFPADQLTMVLSGVSRLLRPGGIWVTDFCELSGELEEIDELVDLDNPTGVLRRRGRLVSGEGEYEVHWSGKNIDMTERYWLKNARAIMRSASKVGFHLIGRYEWSPNGASSKSTNESIEQLISVFSRGWEDGHERTENMED
jgi:hypothetical protein